MPFTAEDVKFTFDKILDKSTNTVRRSNFILDGKPVQFNVIDKYTIEAILPQAFAPFLIRMSMGILPKHILKMKISIKVRTIDLQLEPAHINLNLGNQHSLFS